MIVKLPHRFASRMPAELDLVPPGSDEICIAYDPDAAERLYELTKRWKLENVEVAFVVCGMRAFFSLLARGEWNPDWCVFGGGSDEAAVMHGYEVAVPGWPVRILLSVQLEDDAMVVGTGSLEALRMKSLREQEQEERNFRTSTNGCWQCPACGRRWAVWTRIGDGSAQLFGQVHDVRCQCGQTGQVTL